MFIIFITKRVKKMDKIKCGFCKFEFEGNEDSLKKPCPYCSRKGTLAFEQSAEDIMQDIDKFLERV